METSEERAQLRNNPLFVIGIASLVAIAMFTISFLMYYRSDTRKTIEQIQANNLQEEKNQQDGIFPTGELSESYINSLETTIVQQIESHDDETEFSPSELTDSALGL